MQTTLLGFAIALILALLAALVGPYFVNWNDHRAFFEAEASRLVGLNVRVAGDIDAGILPFPSVTLAGIAIGPEARRAGCAARSLRIELGPRLAAARRNARGRDAAGRPDLQSRAQPRRPDRLAGGRARSRHAVDRPAAHRGRPRHAHRCGAAARGSCSTSCSSTARCARSPGRSAAAASSPPAASATATTSRPAATAPTASGSGLRLETAERPLTMEAEGLLAFERAAPRFDGALTLARPAGTVLATGKAVAHEPVEADRQGQAGAQSATLERDRVPVRAARMGHEPRPARPSSSSASGRASRASSARASSISTACWRPPTRRAGCRCPRCRPSARCSAARCARRGRSRSASTSTRRRSAAHRLQGVGATCGRMARAGSSTGSNSARPASPRSS